MSEYWQPVCQCGEAYRHGDKHHTVPAFTLLHCVLWGADLEKFAIQNNFLKRIFFRLMNTEFGRQGLNCTEQQQETILWLAYPWLCQKTRTKAQRHIWEITIAWCCVFPYVHCLICKPGSPFQANRKFYMFQGDSPSTTNWGDKVVRIKDISARGANTTDELSPHTECMKMLDSCDKRPAKIHTFITF